MARRGRPTVEITLSADERKTLERWARRHCVVAGVGVAQQDRVGLRGRASRTPRSPPSWACTRSRWRKWRHRFAADRLDGLVDAPRPGAARTIGDDVIEAVVVDTLETAPPDATHWSTRGLAAKHGICHTTVAGDLAGVRAQTVAPGQLQGVARPGPGREDPRPGRPCT